MSMFDTDTIRLNVRKEMHLTPWDLARALVAAGLVDDDCCMAEVKVIEKTEVNEGRTVVISWSLSEQRVEQPKTGRFALVVQHEETLEP